MILILCAAEDTRLKSDGGREEKPGKCSLSWWCAQGQCPMDHSPISICRSQHLDTDPQQIGWNRFRTKGENKRSETRFDTIMKQQRTKLAVMC